MSTKKALIIFLLLFLVSLLPSYLIITKAKKMAPSQPKEPLYSGLVRKPAVAGSFYSADEKEVSFKIDFLLNQESVVSPEERMKILIVPHAGIEYSGRVAAAGFKQIKEKNYRRVILLGASHRQWFDYVSIFAKGIWETPLGEVDIDENLAEKILDEPEIRADVLPHQDEHSLEVELIFLQKVLKNFKIVPILVSQTDSELINALAQKIAENLDEETLLIISSDLSHYPSYEVANKVDKETINSVLSAKTTVFEDTIRKLESQNYPNLDTCACGENVIKVGLKVAEILKITDFKQIKYENSGDVSNDKSRVVGYAAIGGYGENISPAVQTLDEKAQKEALTIARQTLEQYLSGRSPYFPTPSSPALQEQLGAFVTLRRQGELRGCIGTFEPEEPLYQVIQKMAIAAATKDSRFLPVNSQELKDIKIEISLMTPKKKVSDWKEIVLGKHGVIVQNGFHSGTFLPQVATETGWTLEELLGQLCSQKAGLPSDCYKDPSVTLYTFEAQVFEED